MFTTFSRPSFHWAENYKLQLVSKAVFDLVIFAFIFKKTIICDSQFFATWTRPDTNLKNSNCFPPSFISQLYGAHNLSVLSVSSRFRVYVTRMVYRSMTVTIHGNSIVGSPTIWHYSNYYSSVHYILSDDRHERYCFPLRNLHDETMSFCIGHCRISHFVQCRVCIVDPFRERDSSHAQPSQDRGSPCVG